MKNKDAKELFGMVPHGTTVIIAQKDKPFRTLKSGDIGSDVLMLQKALKKLGYFHDWTSGKFGDNLKRSVIKYQKANNFKVTGTVGKALYDNIIQKYEDKLNEEETSAGLSEGDCVREITYLSLHQMHNAHPLYQARGAHCAFVSFLFRNTKSPIIYFL